MSWGAPLSRQVILPPIGLPLPHAPITECGPLRSGSQGFMGRLGKLEADLDESRLGQLAAVFGCPADTGAIAAALLQHTELGDDAYAPVRTTVDHLVRHDLAWRAMVQGVVPRPLVAQTLAVTYRTCPTDPADSVPAVVLAAVGEAVSDPRRSGVPRQSADRRTRTATALVKQMLSSIRARASLTNALR